MPLDPADEVLKVLSVKQLPQNMQVPIIYDRKFLNRVLVDTNTVIRACRQDIEKLYEIIELQQLVIDNHEARIIALENA